MSTVTGTSDNASPGVLGESQGGEGVHGVSHSPAAGVAGFNDSTGPGLWGESQNQEGVHGVSHSPAAGVAGINAHPQGGPGVYGESLNGGASGFFKGNVVVTGDLFLEGADYAEELPVADSAVAPGMVVVIDEEGRLRPCLDDYDRRVAGVVSGAGGVRSALVLDRQVGGAAVAMMGKVWVLADADHGQIHCGDLMTGSSTQGHARRVDDVERAIGAILGKALTSLELGQGMVRILVNVS